jgi:hypothetical protein
MNRAWCVGLVVGLVGCGAVPPSPAPRRATATSGPSTPTAPVTSAAPSVDRPCAVVDYDALEPKKPTPDAAVVDLATLFPEDEARTPGAAIRRIDLGRVPFDKAPRGGDLAASMPFGLGWAGLDASWVDGQVSADIASMLASYKGVARARGVEQRGAFLLSDRENELRTFPPDDAGFALGCTVAARARADAAAKANIAALDDLERALVSALEVKRSLSHGERLLLGYFLAERAPPGKADDLAALQRPIALLSELMNDPRAPKPLRARAADVLARTYGDAREGALRIQALERVVELGRDPDLVNESRWKLASMVSDRRARERHLERLIQDLVGVPDERWRRAQALGALAELRLERGEVTGARDAAMECARVSNGTFDDNPDPWGCARSLAPALRAVGGAAPKSDVPRVFLGPLALAMAEDAIGRKDRETARRVVSRSLELVPAAPEAPQLVDLLASITKDPGERAALVARRTTDFAPGSSWHDAQRRALARRNDPASMEQALARLLARAQEVGRPDPETDEDAQGELSIRLMNTLIACEPALARSGREVAVDFDTTGPRPIVRAALASPAVRACLSDAARANFRSVGPAVVKVVLFPQ